MLIRGKARRCADIQLHMISSTEHLDIENGSELLTQPPPSPPKPHGIFQQTIRKLRYDNR